MEKPYESYEGIISVMPGYIGGTTENPSYEEVCSGSTGHIEAVQLTYDPAVISYEELLDIFWRQIDPTDPGGQFADRGSQYTTAIFTHDEEQQKAAEKSKQALADSKKFKDPIVTKITAAGPFYEAEEYHQGYHRKNPAHYNAYRHGSGRGPFLKKTWGSD